MAIKSFEQFMNERKIDEEIGFDDLDDLNINKTGRPKTNTYSLTGGDEYDGGYVVSVTIRGRKVFSDILGPHDGFEYNNKKYKNVFDMIHNIAKDNGIKDGIYGIEVVQDLD